MSMKPNRRPIVVAEVVEDEAALAAVAAAEVATNSYCRGKRSGEGGGELNNYKWQIAD